MKTLKVLCRLCLIAVVITAAFMWGTAVDKPPNQQIEVPQPPNPRTPLRLG
jgi:hypothetical protein